MQTLDANIGKEEKEIFFEKLRGLVESHDLHLRDQLQTFPSEGVSSPSAYFDYFKDTVSIDLQNIGVTTTVADTLGRTRLHNRLFFRISMLVPSLVIEMRSLTDECWELFIPALSLYAESTAEDDDDEGGEGDEKTAAAAAQKSDEKAQKGLGRISGLLSDIWNWVQRVKTLVTTVIHHMASLYSAVHAKDNYQPYTKVHFPLLWHALIDLISAVVSVEEVIFEHDVIRQGVRVYRKMLAQILKHKDKFDADEFTLEQFGRLLNKIESELLDDGILERLVSQPFDSVELGINVTMNPMFFQEFHQMFSGIAKTIGDSLGTPREGDGRRKLIGLLGVHYLQFTLFKDKYRNDPALQREVTGQIFELHRKVPVVFIAGDVMLRPGQWMSRRMPSALRAIVKDPNKESMLSIKTECSRMAAEFPTRVNFFNTVTTIWAAQMHSSFPADRVHAKALVTTMTQLLQRGIYFAQDISRLTKHVIAIHQAADVALSLTLVDAIAHAVELLHMIRSVVHDKQSLLASVYPLLLQASGYQMHRQLFVLYQRLNDILQSSGESVTDQHSAIGQALALLQRAQTTQNLICLDISLSIAFNREDGAFPSKEYEDVLAQFATLTRLANMQKLIRTATDCDFLYWQRETFIPMFFKRAYKKPSRTEYLPYLVSCLHDARPLILSARHVAKPVQLLDKYIRFVRTCLIDELVAPLRTDIENNLRLYTHAVVLGMPYRKLEMTPTDGSSSSMSDLSRYCRLPAMRFFNESLRIADLVEDYLDAQFYNLNALMTNDWKTYEEMRNIAWERFGLRIAEGHLPGSIVDQGLDVLVIAENIQVFVANYTYNLNEQLFVQRPHVTESKNLHTLHIRHVANSIRTHGSGIMNTTVNYVYKCLLKKLAIVSQFLYDDHVKSRLMKDLKHFQQHKDESYKGLYPLARADKFIAEIRKLGVTDDGRTFLDQFRGLVSEIGNALGYMRMVRSGGLRAIADAAAFIPSMENIPRLEKLANPSAPPLDDGELDDSEETNDKPDDDDDAEEDEEEAACVSESTQHSIRVVDRVVRHMNRKLAQGSDYFGLLQDAIAKRLKDPVKYGHLKYFFMIVPPLCVSHVEYMVRQKEQLVKKNKDGLFTDDGLAIGCVFLLSLFSGFDSFDSLHWFESVIVNYTERLAQLQSTMAKINEKEKQKKKSKSTDGEGDDDDIKTMQLTVSMAEYALKEYQGLERTFTSSRVFFQHHTAVAEDEEAEEEDDA